MAPRLLPGVDMSQTLLVGEVMTPVPRTVDVAVTVGDARRLMERFGVRHLPVVDAGDLVGVVSRSDLRRGGRARPLGEVMSRAPWTVTPATPVEVAARHMGTRRLGSAVVVDQGMVVGIFTATDGLRALARVLALQ